MASILAAGRAIAAQLTAAGARATVDPAWANVNRPCLLVAPPTIDYHARTNTWRVVALSSHAGGTLAALQQLDELVQLAGQALHVEHAEPASYALTPESGTVPAYILRVTT